MFKSKLQVFSKRRPQGKKTIKKLNVAKLKQEDVVAGLASLDSKLECVQLGSSPVDDDWSALKTDSTRISDEQISSFLADKDRTGRWRSIRCLPSDKRSETGPTLFTVMFSAMLTDVLRDSEEGILIRYRTNGKLFTRRLLLAVTKVKETVIKDFLFANDCALNATSEQAMQASTERLSGACDKVGFTISNKKTEVLYQPCPGEPHQKPTSQ